MIVIAIFHPLTVNIIGMRTTASDELSREEHYHCRLRLLPHWTQGSRSLP